MKKLSPALLATLLLGGAAFLTGIAWQYQASAASNLALAYEIQGRDLKESDSSPPSIEDNRAVIDVLGDSIGIRRDIDGLLQRVEADVEYLRGAQQDANARTLDVHDELEGIAAQLGIAAEAAGSSAGKLSALDGELGVSARLARAIAEELEKLDRKLGPSIGGEP